jgi:hypothetical protein
VGIFGKLHIFTEVSVSLFFFVFGVGKNVISCDDGGIFLFVVFLSILFGLIINEHNLVALNARSKSKKL